MFLRCKNSPAAKLAPSSRWSWEAIKKEAIGRKEEDKTQRRQAKKGHETRSHALGQANQNRADQDRG